MIRKILSILSARERREGALLALGNAFVSVLDIATLGILLYLVAFYTGGQPAKSIRFLPAWSSDSHSLAPISVFFLFFLVKSAGGLLLTGAQYRFVYRVASRISETNMLRYLEGAYADYIHVDASVRIRSIGQQPVEFSQYVLAGMQQLVTECCLVALSMAAIIWYDSRLFFLLSCLLAPAVGILAFFSRKRLKSVRGDIQLSGEKSLQYLREALGGYVEANLYDRIPFFARRYGRRQARLNEHLSVLQILQAVPTRLIEVFAVMGLFVLIVFAKWSGNAQTASYITLGAFLAAAYKIIPGLVRIFNISGQIKTYRFTVDDLATQALKPPAAVPPTAPPIGSVVFRNLGFSRPQGRVLKRLDLCLNSGEIAGLTGASGRGKTTIVNLLLGFLRPQEGAILVNGQPADPDRLRAYWPRISYVQQHPFLLHDTILKNIVLGDDGYDKGRLRKALDAAGLQQLVASSSEGLEKMITENGKNISGGQRQRIAFARAVYKDADLLILDEPFSELDETSEKELLCYCRKLAGTGKIVLLITHRQQNLALCHQTVVLDAKG
ncbi:MAG TPA: ABC transporter ATP-binding protein [Puia sp.]|nr:ABC transporter ATP-binding protein [Puia sp.]